MSGVECDRFFGGKQGRAFQQLLSVRPPACRKQIKALPKNNVWRDQLLAGRDTLPVLQFGAIPLEARRA
jgi:hypothetical protein